MIQDINETYDNTYHRYAIEDKDAVLIYKGFSVLTKKAGNGTVFPSFSEAGGEPASYIYLFSVGEKRFFIPVSGEDMTVKGYDFTDLRSLFDTDRNSPAAFAAVTGMQLNNWYEARRYCGPNVKNDPIAIQVKHTVQRDRGLYHAQIGSEMPAVLRNGVNDLFSDVLR